MATTPRSRAGRAIDYPTGDGKPMAETDVHRDLMFDLIGTLQVRLVDDPMAYVSGNLLLFYEEGNRRKHVSPDVFVVLGVEKKRREHYLTWLEGRGPDLVIELTSKSTKSEDIHKKMDLYRDVIRVPEYFLFDPFEDYLRPSMQGYRLAGGRYEPIAWVDGRLPSAVLGLHLERDGIALRLRDPATGRRLGRGRAAPGRGRAAPGRGRAAPGRAGRGGGRPAPPRAGGPPARPRTGLMMDASWPMGEGEPRRSPGPTSDAPPLSLPRPSSLNQ